MSTREIAYRILDSFTDEQLEGFIILFGRLVDISNEETRKALEEFRDSRQHPEKN